MQAHTRGSALTESVDTGSLEQETRHLWLMTCSLITAEDSNDREAVDEWTEAFELFCLLAENESIRKAANRNMHFILGLRQTQAPKPVPVLSFVSGAAALLDAIARNLAAPVPAPEAVAPLAVAIGD